MPNQYQVSDQHGVALSPFLKTEQEAIKYARRMAKQHPGDTFFVMVAVRGYRKEPSGLEAPA